MISTSVCLDKKVASVLRDCLLSREVAARALVACCVSVFILGLACVGSAGQVSICFDSKVVREGVLQKVVYRVSYVFAVGLGQEAVVVECS